MATLKIFGLSLMGYNNDSVGINMAIAEGADVNEHDLNGVTALIEASREGNVACVVLLLSIGANINHTDNVCEFIDLCNFLSPCAQFYEKVGKTALILARENFHDKCVKIIEKFDGKCRDCPVEFGFLWPKRHHCKKCRVDICDECSHKNHDRICKRCFCVAEVLVNANSAKGEIPICEWSSETCSIWILSHGNDFGAAAAKFRSAGVGGGALCNMPDFAIMEMLDGVPLVLQQTFIADIRRYAQHEKQKQVESEHCPRDPPRMHHPH